MADPSGTSEARDELLNQLGGEFADRQRRGEQPSLEEYCRRHPDLANDIRSLFPAMVELERAKADARPELAVAGAEASPVTLLGDFRLLREVGRGGMGVVYEAEQVSLGRRVALKLLPASVFRDVTKRRRFEREAKAAAKLHHTNIVPVHGFGEHDGTPYYVMQFIPGLGLDAVIDELGRRPGTSRSAGPDQPPTGEQTALSAVLARSLVGDDTAGTTGWNRPAPEGSSPTEIGGIAPGPAPLSQPARGPSVLPSTSGVHLPGQSGSGVSVSGGKKSTYWEGVARIGVQVAGALAYAHKQGVLHRDIKPANLLLDLDGTVWITDFGLAKAEDSDDLTQTGNLLGTLRYMPPEAFDGKSDARGDVYGLGLTLFEMVALRPAYEERDRNKLIKQVTAGDPPRLRRLRRDAPRDLVTIVEKATDKDPARRYQTAGALADDLQRFVEDRPVRARRPSAAERYWRWARRNPVIAVLGGLLTVVLVLATASSLIVAGRMAHLAENERSSAQAERSALQEASARERGERWERYCSNIAEAAAAQQLQNSSTGQRALEAAPEEHRNWEWRHLHSLLDGASRVIPVPGMNSLAMRISPDGHQVAVGTSRGEVYLFDVATGRPGPILRGHVGAVECLEYSPDGRQLGSGAQDGTICLWDPETGRQQFVLRGDGIRIPDGVRNPQLHYRSDGKRVITEEPSAEARTITCRLWDGTSGRQLAVLGQSVDTGSRQAAAFSLDGKRAVAADGRSLRIFDAETARLLKVVGPFDGDVDWILFFPDRKRFLVTLKDTATPSHFRDCETGELLAALEDQKGQLIKGAFSADGSRLATSGVRPDDKTVSLWQTGSGKLVATLSGHTNTINALVYSAVGKRLASASHDQTGRLWDGETGRQIAVLRGHTGPLYNAVFSPDGTRLVTASGDSTMRLWDAGSGDLITVLRGQGGGIVAPVFTADGSWLVSPSADQTVRVWDMKVVERNGVLRGHTEQVYDVAVRPDGREVASAAWDGTVRLWDPDTGRQTRVLRGDAEIITAVAYSPDGRHVAATIRERGVTVWDAATGKREHFWPGDTGSWRGDSRAAFSPDGTLVAAGSAAGPVRLWRVATGEQVAKLVGHDGGSCGVAFAPGGTTVASAGLDGTVRLWDVGTGKPLAILRGHTDRVIHVAYSPDGRLIASGSADRTVRLWDAGTRDAIATVNVGSNVYGVAFSPDGTRLALGCGDTTVRLIDVARRREVVGLRGQADFVSAVAWSPDGTRLVSASGDLTVRVWDSLSIQERARESQEKPPRAEVAPGRARRPAGRHEG